MTGEDRAALGQQLFEAYTEMNALRERMRDLRREMAGEITADYTLTQSDGKTVALSDLFGDKQDLLVVHNMGKSCPYCTLWADGLNSLMPHIESRCALVLVSPDAPTVQVEFAGSRGWVFAMASSGGTTFTRDMGFEEENGDKLPGVSAFHRAEDGSITRIASSPFGPYDEYCAVWHLFDLLDGGVGDWEPKYKYA